MPLRETAPEDADEALAKIVKLGGSVIMGADDSPYGRLAQAAARPVQYSRSSKAEQPIPHETEVAT